MASTFPILLTDNGSYFHYLREKVVCTRQGKLSCPKKIEKRYKKEIW